MADTYDIARRDVGMNDAGGPDLAEVVGRFGDLLHRAGMPVTPVAAGRFAEAFTLARPERTDDLYWLGRVTLVTDRAQLSIYDRVFTDVFRGVLDAADANRQPDTPLSTRPSEGSPRRDKAPNDVAGGESQASRPSAAGSSTGDAGDDEGVLAAASDEERLSGKPFGQCTPEELEALRALLGEFRLDPPARRSRRTRVHPLGRDVDLRATVRAAHRTGGDPLHQIRRRRRTRPRRVVLIADVSGSMESYGRAYLYLLHSAVRSIGAEAFVFATRLHRLTRPLALQHPAAALARAMAQAPDWSGGTRIGRALQAFNDGHARRGVGRGAIVVIVSDGWEGGDPSLIAREMERLSRLAHRIIWVNPRKQSAAYQPLVGGMAAALPFVDTFLSGHSVTHLAEVVRAITEADDTPRSRRPVATATSTSNVAAAPPPVDHTVIPTTSMRPDYGTVLKVSPHRRWDFTTAPV